MSTERAAFGWPLALAVLLLQGCPTTGGPDELDPIDDRQQDYYEYECPDCAPPGEPIPGQVP